MCNTLHIKKQLFTLLMFNTLYINKHIINFLMYKNLYNSQTDNNVHQINISYLTVKNNQCNIKKYIINIENHKILSKNKRIKSLWYNKCLEPQLQKQ